MKRVLSAVLVFLLLVCCSGPTKYVDRPEGTVWGWDPEVAERLGEALPLAERVRERLGSARKQRVEVHILEPDDRSLSSYGACFSTHIEITPRGMRSPEYVLAHEACHWYINESRFDGLPYWIEEALCDWIAHEQLGQLEARRAQLEGVEPPLIHLAYLKYDTTGWKRLTEGEILALYLYGFRVVDTIGLERLAEMNASGSSHLDYMEAAGLSVRIHPLAATDSLWDDPR